MQNLSSELIRNNAKSEGYKYGVAECPSLRRHILANASAWVYGCPSVPPEVRGWLAGIAEAEKLFEFRQIGVSDRSSN